MNLLITGAWPDAELYIPELQQLGHRIRFMQQEKGPLPCDAAWVEGVICGGLFLYHPIDRFRNLRYIQATSAGLDQMPMDYIRAHQIELYNARGVYSIPMAELALCGVLQLYKQSRFFYKNQKAHQWEKNRELLELNGKTVVIIGCGSIGTECAKRFRAFGCSVVGVDLLSREDPYYDRILSLDGLDDALPQADVVVLTLPLTDKTYHLMDSQRLRLLKATAILVNIARGAIVDTGALEEVLPKIGGAVLDVFEEEPLAEDSPLWAMENVIVTPHNSFAGDGNKERLFQTFLLHLS